MKDLSIYEKYRAGMKTGDLIEWHDNSIVGAGIRDVTGYDVNHSSLVVVLNSPFSGFRVLLVEALTSGVEITFASQRLASTDGNAYYYPLKDENAVPSWMAPVERNAFAFVGQKYDFTDVAQQMFHHTAIGDYIQVFCSELVQICTGGKIGDIAFRPGELPEKWPKWKPRIQFT